MRCEEIQERFVELLYDEQGTTPASPELLKHVRSCPACQEELAGLRKVQGFLKLWEDEPPLMPVNVSSSVTRFRPGRLSVLRLARYAAVAAMLLLAFLALTNIEISWNKDGFSFKTQIPFLVPKGDDYYTKQEVLTILKEVLEDSEARMTRVNFQMMQQMLDTIEAERYMDLQHIGYRGLSRGEKN